MQQRTLRIKDEGQPAREPAPSRWTAGTGPSAVVEERATAPLPVQVEAPSPPAEPTTIATATTATTVAPPAAVAPSTDSVLEKVLGIVAEKTGYPRDMLDLDLDLEADLGIDTVKQAEVFAMVRETFGIPRQDNLKLRDYPTLAPRGWLRGAGQGRRAGDGRCSAGYRGFDHASGRDGGQCRGGGWR